MSIYREGYREDETQQSKISSREILFCSKKKKYHKGVQIVSQVAQKCFKISTFGNV